MHISLKCTTFARRKYIMLYQWLISLPMMVCFFWAVFFAVRAFEYGKDPWLNTTILLFFVAATVLYTDHWLYFSEFKTFLGLWSYLVANLCVYPLYYAYLRALTHSEKSIEVLLFLIPAAVIFIFFPLNARFGWLDGEYMLFFVRICFAFEVVWVWWRGTRLLRQTRARLDDTYSDDRGHLLHPTLIIQHLLGITAAISMLLNFLGRDFFAESMMATIPAVLMSTLLFAIGYVADRTRLPQEIIKSDYSGDEQTVLNEESDSLCSGLTHSCGTDNFTETVHTDRQLVEQKRRR